MASSALEITRKAAGRVAIKALMILDPVNEQRQDIMSNVCCHIASAFEQSVVTAVVNQLLDLCSAFQNAQCAACTVVCA